MSGFTLNGIVDSTLREGNQTPGFEFSFKQKLEIINSLNVLGVEEVELGVATPRSPELVSRLQLLADRNNIQATDFYQKLGWQATQLICLRKVVS